jgi:thiosulfate/3-mercaptopyruvate sulfurtransferase
MSFGPVISPEVLAASRASLCLLDARRATEFSTGHLEGAMLADLETHLSAASTPGFDPARGGRHPLPTLQAWLAQLGAWGITPETRVVAYDGASGASAACRLWWMLRAVGHDRVAVLDGGLDAARAAGMGCTSAAPGPRPAAAPYPADHWLLALADIEEVAQRASDPSWRVLDVRSRERWRGENETLDPVPGRIPGTINVPYSENLRPDGRFEAPQVLRRKYLAALGETPPDQLVVHCGSGVTACHTLLALELAGLHGAALYVGSYGEWCRSGRPVGRGPSDR